MNTPPSSLLSSSPACSARAQAYAHIHARPDGDGNGYAHPPAHAAAGAAPPGGPQAQLTQASGNSSSARGPPPPPSPPHQFSPPNHVNDRIKTFKAHMAGGGESGSGSGASSGYRGLGKASPSSTSGSAIAVGTSADAAVIQSIEKGEFPQPEDDTRSLTDSIRQHIVEGGLRYHAYHAGKYVLPNDENEQNREDLKHNLTVYLCDGNLFYAPVHRTLEDGGAEVLDLGTGTGKWCIEVADMYPKATIHGMDLSPIQPDWIPENVSFVVDDIEHEAGWTYQDDCFDFIYMRHTVPFIRDRPDLWERIYQHLKPGGWVEISEFQYAAACDDNTCDEPYAWRDFIHYLEQGMKNLGTDLQGITAVDKELAAAGFEDVRIKNLKCPVGPWAKKKKLQECGHVLRDVILFGLDGMARKPFRDGLNWTDIQIQMFLVEVRKAISAERNGLPKFHSYYPFRSVCARKPLDGK